MPKHGILITLALVLLSLSIACGQYRQQENPPPLRTPAISGTIIDAYTGDPVIAASIHLMGTTLGALTDFDGHFTVRGIAPGKYVLKVAHLDFETKTSDSIVVLRDTIVAVNFELKPDDHSYSNIPTSTPRYILDMYEAIHFNNRLAGTLIDLNTSLPIESAEIKLSRSTYSSLTDSSGHFEFTGLYEWSFALQATHPRYDTLLVEGVEITKDTDTTVTLRMSPH